LHVTVFDLPSVEVGSILEYRYRFVGLSIFKFIKANMVSSTEYFYLPAWWIQQKYFVHKEHFSMMPADKLSTIYTTRLPVGAKLVIDKRGEFSLDMSDIPATPDEDWMPPLNSTKWSVDFAITRSSTYTVKELWEDQSQLWAIHMNYLTSPTSELKKIVAEIIAPIDTDAQKARKIYDAVQKLDNTAFSRVKSETERKKEGLKDQNKIEDIWKQKSGSDDDIAALYVALARSAGLTAWPIAVTDRSRAIFDKNTLTIEQLDDVIAVVVIDGKDVYLDPGQKMCPFGILKWNHSLAAGFRLADKGAKDSISGHKDYSNYIGMRLTNNVTIMDMTPAASYKESAVQQAADLTIDEAGNVKGTARILLSGQDALRWRQLALRNDEEEVKRQFMDELRGSLPDGIQADFDHFDALSDYNAKLVAVVKISGNLGSVTGKHIFLPGLFFESRAKHPFTTQDKRITPVDLHYAKMEQDDVTYHLPDGYTVEGAIKASNISWPDHAMLRYNSVEKPGVLQVQRTFARNFALLEPTAYNDLHDFYLKLAAADQQQIVLTRAAVAAKGN
jgi:hypothetical protein